MAFNPCHPLSPSRSAKSCELGLARRPFATTRSPRYRYAWLAMLVNWRQAFCRRCWYGYLHIVVAGGQQRDNRRTGPMRSIFTYKVSTEANGISRHCCKLYGALSRYMFGIIHSSERLRTAVYLHTMYSYQRCMHVHLVWHGRGAYHIREQGCWSKSA